MNRQARTMTIATRREDSPTAAILEAYPYVPVRRCGPLEVPSTVGNSPAPMTDCIGYAPAFLDDATGCAVRIVCITFAADDGTRYPYIVQQWSDESSGPITLCMGSCIMHGLRAAEIQRENRDGMREDYCGISADRLYLWAQMVESAISDACSAVNRSLAYLHA